MVSERPVRTRKKGKRVETNPNLSFYERIAAVYDLLYAEVDPEEAVRQWLLLTRRFMCIPRQDQKAPLRLLDVGCGTGRYLEPWALAGFDVTGIDGSPSMIAHARCRRNRSESRCRIHLLQGDLRQLNPRLEKRGPFDIAVAHFNFLNLFPVAELRLVFGSLRCYFVAGGRLFADCAIPAQMPEKGVERTSLSNGLVVKASTHPNLEAMTVIRRYSFDGTHIHEKYWMHSESSLRSVAATSGWRLESVIAWRPDRPENPWCIPGGRRDHRVHVFTALG